MKKPRNSFHGYNVMPSALRKHTLSKQGYFCLFVRFFGTCALHMQCHSPNLRRPAFILSLRRTGPDVLSNQAPALLP